MSSFRKHVESSAHWGFPAEFVREQVRGLVMAARKLSEWSERAAKHGAAPGTTFASVTVESRTRVWLLFATRERWLREWPGIAEAAEFALGSAELRIVVSDAATTDIGKLVTLSEFRECVREAALTGAC